MAGLPTLRARVLIPFPSLVTATGPIRVTKSNGIWAITFTYEGFPSASLPLDPTKQRILLQNSESLAFTVATLADAVAQAKGTFLQVTTAGPHTIAAGVGMVAVVRNNPLTPTNLTFPQTSLQGRLDIVVVDYSTGLTEAHDIVVTPNALDTGGVMKQPTWTVRSAPGGFLGVETFKPVNELLGWVVE